MRPSPLLALTLFALACRSDDKDVVLDTNVDTAPQTVDEDGDGFTGEDDCDDTDPAVNAGAAETCDGLDNDCDGEADEDATDAATFYADADGDGFGVEAYTETACEAPVGYASEVGDCDDQDAAIYPGAVEDDCLDPTDYNCDGSSGLTDGDADGFAACEECDDTNRAVNPSATEICDDLDNNCDGEADVGAVDAATWYQDADTDGYGDTDFSQESCDTPEGYASEDGDCDDAVASTNPGAAEVCDDVDNDCNGSVDDDATDAATYYSDRDQDGYGDPATGKASCGQPTGTVDNDGDCNDKEELAWDGATEVCDEVDNNCDGSVDEGLTTTYYLDNDEDGYGNAKRSVTACSAPDGYVENTDDCDDTEEAAWTGATEICDEIDNNCDGSVDEGVESTWYLDVDGDGYGGSRSTDACSPPTSDYVAADGDCDDGDNDAYPGASLGCDGGDYDCDGDVDNDADGDGYADATCGGDDCDDGDAVVLPELGGGCALGTTCLDVLANGYSAGDGIYTIDPDGFGAGLDPFDVECDMTTDGGGWTVIEYSADLTFQQQFTGGDRYRFLGSDFTLDLSDAQITAIQALSTEGNQTYVGLCEHVIHYYYTAGGGHDYSFGFRFFDGTETAAGLASYSPYDITVTADGCAVNGGEGGALAKATLFEINSVKVPVVNVQCRDCGDATPEKFGSPLMSYPAYLR